MGALVMNTYHLMQRPGSSTIRALGGLHAMTGWRRPIVTDSGGFQIYSLIRQNPKLGTLGDRGATFTPDGERRFTLTPEKSIQLQLGYGADVLICLDDCTHADDPPAEQLRSVRRTIDWARRSKATLDRLADETGVAGPDRPLLFAVIQGGADPDLRRRCAEELLTIGFDGYGYGGWPLDGRGNLLTDMLALTRELIPPAVPLHALGIGHPANVAACVRMGYPLFDSAMPTRDARNGRLYAFTTDDPAAIGRGDGWFEYVHPGDLRHVKAAGPVSARCDCHACSTYSLGYLHHLFKLGDGLYARLATIHNLRFMAQLMERLGAGMPPRAAGTTADVTPAAMGERPGQAAATIQSGRTGALPERSVVLPPAPDPALDRLAAEVLASARYAAVMPELVRRIGAAELATRRGQRAAARAVKRKLHQAAGAYLDTKPPFEAWLADLRAGAASPDALRAACRAILAAHASSRERLPILERFFAEALDGLGPVESVLDVACGLGPLAIPWMPLARGAAYAACDVRSDVVAFMGEALPLLGVAGDAFTWDVAASAPPRRAAVALILKALPCLELLDRGAGRRLVDGLQADRVLVSFPVRSLGGRGKGMARTYESRMRAVLAGRDWPVTRFDFETELAFLIDKRI